MKIIDCEKQLHKSLKLFDDIYKYNNKISDILMKRGEKITFKEVCSIFECVYTIYKIMPYEFNSKYLKYFDNIDMNWLFKLKDDLKSLYDISVPCELFETITNIIVKTKTIDKHIIKFLINLFFCCLILTSRFFS